MLRAAFTVRSLSHTRNQLRVAWGDGTQSNYPNVFLRGSVRDAKFFDQESYMYEADHLPFVLADAPIVSAEHQPGQDEAIAVEWKDHSSTFNPLWLRAQDIRNTKDLAEPLASPTAWDSSIPGGVREYDFAKLSEKFVSLMKDLKRWGIVLIHGCPRNERGILETLQMIGPLRQRHSPVNIFKLSRGPEADNVEEYNKALAVDRAAYGSEFLGGHTDATEYDIPSKFETFLCIDYSAPVEDTYSFVVDGIKVVEVLKETDPETFNILSSTPSLFGRRRLTVEIECDPQDERMYQYDYVVREPVISLDSRGNLSRIRFRHNKVIGFPPDTPKALDIYRAYDKLQQTLNNREYHISYVLKPGTMMLFDNQRVCHGRYKIFPGTTRHMLGAYIAQDTWESRWRLMLAEMAGLPGKWLYGCSEDSLNILTRRLE